MSTPWERQTGEPEAAYRAFAIYRDLGPARSLRAVTTAIGTQTARRDNAAAVIVVSSSEQRESKERAEVQRRHPFFE